MTTTQTLVMIRLTSKIILRTEVKNKMGLAPVCIQCFLEGKRIVISLGFKISNDNWNSTTQRVICSNKSSLTKNEAQQFNDLLIKATARINEIRHHYTMISHPLDEQLLRFEFSSDQNRLDFISFIDEEMKHLKNISAPGTIKNLKTTIAKLKSFSPKISFVDLNDKFIAAFESKLKKSGLKSSTIWKHHKDVKMFINAAINKRGYKIINPYENFKVRFIKGRRDWLDQDEVLNLQKKMDSGTLRGEHVKVLRYFLFSCFTGLRISDVKRLTHDDIIDGQLIFTPEKTKHIGKLNRVPLNKTALNLINTQEGKLFETISDQKTNKYLKSIMIEAEIKKHVSFHIARHTFAMMFLNNGGNIEILQKLLGHSKIETTMEYVHYKNTTAKEQVLFLDQKVTTQVAVPTPG